jgi:cation:H+ antiporter
MTYVLFVLGFGLLIKGANWLVEGSSKIADRLGVSELLIGLTIVAFGTSMPEMIINILASISGNAGLATGNVLGSNIANVLLIIGATAIITDLPVQRNTVLSEIPFSLTAALLVGFLANSALWYEHSDELHISRGDGAIILFFFLLFMSYVILTAGEDRQPGKQERTEETPPSQRKTIGLVVLGCLSLFLGGKWVVDGAILIAQSVGLSETFIGLTIVAVGTSLPELVTSIMAARKKNTDIAIGNAVGSNIFNILWVLGLSALINPLPFNVASNIDIMVVIGASSMILLAMILGRRMQIRRLEGIIFVLSYFAYLAYLIVRG